MTFVNLHINEHGVPPNKNLGRRLEIARTARGLTQTQLASILHTSQKTISQWEAKGNFPSFMIGAIAQATDQEAEFFIIYER